MAVKPDGKEAGAVFMQNRVFFAGYPHLYYPSNRAWIEISKVQVK